MKVVLVNPPVATERYRSRRASIPALGMACVASYLRAQGVDCEVVDGKADGLSPDDVRDRIAQMGPDVLGLTAMTPDILSAAKIAGHAKQQRPGIQTIVGGAHAIALPRETLEEFPQFDYVCTGEGEVTLFELVQSISRGGIGGTIQGLGLRRDGAIVVNPARPYIQDLDSLPFPDWSRLRSRSGVYCLLSSRGCPFRCSFCSRASGRVVRERSPENVVDEIESLVRTRSARKVIFVDETFTLRKPRVVAITEEIISRGLHRRIGWVAQTRADLGELALFKRMKEAGCVELEFGVESGNQDVLGRVHKGLRLEQVGKTIEMARQARLRVGCTFILGHPGETERTIQDTIDFAVRINPDSVSFGIMSPYPGTEIWEMAKAGEGNYRLLSRDWDQFLRFGGGALELSNLPRRRLEMLQVKAYVTFYLRTLRIAGLLAYGVPRWRQALAVLRKLAQRHEGLADAS